MLLSKKVQAFKNLKSHLLKWQMCGPNKLNRCHQHFSFQALECFFLQPVFKKNKKNCLYFVLTVILLKVLIPKTETSYFLFY